MRYRANDAGTGLGRLKLVSYVALVLAVASMLVIVAVAREVTTYYSPSTASTAQQFLPVTVTGDLITPPLSNADAPPILAQQPPGSRLTDMNVPLNSSELSAINDAPDSYFETAAGMYLNHSLSNSVGATIAPAPLFTVNGKPAVVYLGAISCIYCAENRWAMALALSRFGTFQQLFQGYSSLGDGDIPTIYWAPSHYNSSSAVEFGNFYVGKYVTFVSIEYSSPITQGFMMGALSYFQQEATAIANPIYENATAIITGLNNFNGTPYTIWGKYNVASADAVDFGNTSSSLTNPPIASMTHGQVLASFADPTSQFAWTEYAAADYYAALICAGGGAAAAAPVCSLPSVSTMTAQVKG
jgi:hypothetical protein